MKLEERIEQAIIEALERQERLLANMQNMIWRQIAETQRIYQEYGQTTNNNTLNWLASEQGNIILRSFYVFLDPNVGGTYTLQLGNISVKKPCPVSGFEYFIGAGFILKQNAPRSLIVTSTNTSAYIQVVGFGEKAGDTGWIV